MLQGRAEKHRLFYVDDFCLFVRNFYTVNIDGGGDKVFHVERIGSRFPSLRVGEKGALWIKLFLENTSSASFLGTFPLWGRLRWIGDFGHGGGRATHSLPLRVGERSSIAITDSRTHFILSPEIPMLRIALRVRLRFASLRMTRVGANKKPPTRETCGRFCIAV